MKKTRVICLMMAAALALTLPGASEVSAAKKQKGKAQTKIALNKTKAQLTVGQKLKLKVKNTKKKAKWSTSKKAVATVNKSGKVTAKKPGKANIIAKIGKKKLKCKITVKAKNGGQAQLQPQGAQPQGGGQGSQTAAQVPGIASVTVLNSHNIQVRLTMPVALSAGNFTVKTKSYAQGIYNRELKVSEASSSDSMTYSLLLDVDNYVSENRYVQVSVNVPGMSPAAGEAIFSKGAFAYQSNVIYYGTQGEAVSKSFDVDDGYGYGSLVSVTGLPDGVSYASAAAAATGGALSVSENEIRFTGVPTKTGTFRGNITTKDELGNTYSYEMIWLIGSKKAIAAAYTQTYGVIGSNGYRISKGINVTGGSGWYDYEIQGSSHGLEIDSEGYITGNLTESGTYEIKVKITDEDDKSITTTETCKISLIKGRTISGIVKDAVGDAIKNTGVNIYFENKDRANLYQTYASTYTDEKGAYSVTLMGGGTYEAYASFAYARGELITCEVSGDKSGVDFEVPVYGVTINTDEDKFDVSGSWYASDDTSYSCYNKTIYLRAGTYELTKKMTVGLIEYTGKISLTVGPSTTSVKAEVTSKNQLEDSLKGEIKAEEPVDISSLTYDLIYYTFVPETDMRYYFFSEGTADTYGVLLDENGYNLNSSYGGGSGENFSFSYYCEAGHTYYVGIRSDYYEGDSARLVVSEHDYLYYDIQDKLAGTVEAENPLPIILTEDYKYYEFTPEYSGYYYFYTTGDYDTYGQLVTPDGTYTDDDDYDYNFCIGEYCYSGETYYIGAKNYESGESYAGEVSLVVSGSDPNNY